jgi:N-methylhydantoinase A
VVDSLMEDLVRRVTVQRGQDPRDFDLWVYGGASGAHAGLFSRQLGVRRIVLPHGGTASVWSALGCTLLRPRREFATSVYFTPPWELERVAGTLDRLTHDAHAYAASIGLAPGSYSLRPSANLRYGLQVHEVEVPIDDGAVSAEWAEQLVDRFEHAYEDRFGAGTGFPGAGATLTALRIVLEAGDEGPPTVHSDEPSTDEPTRTRPVFFREVDDWVDTPIVPGGALVVDEVHPGPVIVEYPHTTVVARPGQRLWADRHGIVVLDTNGGQ